MAGFGAVDRLELRDSRVLPETGQRPAALLVVRESERGLPVTVEPTVRAAGLVIPVGEPSVKYLRADSIGLTDTEDGFSARVSYLWNA
jgi:hypothetical protein